MKSFLKYVFATLVSLILFSFIGVIILISLIYSSVPKIEIEENSVLEIKLDRKIIERESGDLLTQLKRPFNSSERGSIGLLELRQAIKAAAESEKVKGVFLNISNLDAGVATIEELRNELMSFKESGKFVVSYASSYSELGYYLASVADKVYLPPSGMLEFNGLHTEVLFFKKLLDKLQIEPEVFKVGQYKSAVEPFIAEKMSDSNRKQLQVLLNSVYSHILSQIGETRDISPEKLRSIADQMLVRSPEDALKYKLITDLAYIDDAEEFMRGKIGLNNDEEICYTDYWSMLDFSEPKEILEGDKIAVIYAVGDIQDGNGDDRVIGSETMVREIKKAREDSSIKAVVLRVNSPGGSALASDVIWREVLVTKKVKPVIASMGDVAASGGYYISAACDSILSLPTTITGSIGVFGVLFNGKDFLNNKLYISTDREKTGPFADIGSFTRPLNKEEEAIIQQEVEDIYVKFLEVVAQGRNLDTSYVNTIAQGRVWSGINAQENKLVDKPAGLDEAVRVAASMAQLESFETVYLPERPNLFLKQLLSDTRTALKEDILQEELGDFYQWVRAARKVKEIKGIQTRLPADIIIK